MRGRVCTRGDVREGECFLARVRACVGKRLLLVEPFFVAVLVW